MDAAEVIQTLIKVLLRTPSISQDELIHAMVVAGVEESQADLAYKFAQIAFGRCLLDGIVNLPAEYVRLRADGSIVVQGKLADEPLFIAANDAVKGFAGSTGWQNLALGSAEVNAVNKALHAGSDPKDLVLAPSILFDEPPTERGMAKAQEFMQAYFAKHGHQKPQKAWWQFWK